MKYRMSERDMASVTVIISSDTRLFNDICKIIIHLLIIFDLSEEQLSRVPVKSLLD